MSECPGDGEWGEIPDELEERIEARRDAEWEAKYNKSTPHALTREQVAHHASEIEHCDPEFITDHVKVLVATDAALRQALAQQAQEIERLKVDVVKRDCVLTLLHFIVEHDGDFDNPEAVEAEAIGNGLENVLMLKQQFAASQQRVMELELRWKPVEESARKTFEIESLPILLNGGTRGQERLAQIIASWHEAEKKCATLQATLDGRELRIRELETMVRLREATLAEREAELEKHKAMLKHSIEDECDAEQLLVAAGISDYEEGEHGEYRGLHTQLELCIKQRDTARQDAARYKQFVEWASTADSGVWAFQIREKAQRVLQGLE